MEQGQASGVTLDPTCLAQSSQGELMQSKPDYRGLLRRQLPVLHTMEMVVCWNYYIRQHWRIHTTVQRRKLPFFYMGLELWKFVGMKTTKKAFIFHVLSFSPGTIPSIIPVTGNFQEYSWVFFFYTPNPS